MSKESLQIGEYICYACGSFHDKHTRYDYYDVNLLKHFCEDCGPGWLALLNAQYAERLAFLQSKKANH